MSAGNSRWPEALAEASDRREQEHGAGWASRSLDALVCELAEAVADVGARVTLAAQVIDLEDLTPGDRDRIRAKLAIVLNAQAEAHEALHDAHRIANLDGKPPARSAIGQAVNVIETHLPADGRWYAASAIVQAGVAASVTARTMQRAKASLGIEHRRSPAFHAPTEWRWPRNATAALATNRCVCNRPTVDGDEDHCVKCGRAITRPRRLPLATTSRDTTTSRLSVPSVSNASAQR